ncbi:MAG TPA: ribosome maturation factor RimM [Desulfotomaculum sp.]|nr:ribosome maturation factor RimM [Desulfotomaculum sp.]
MTLDYITVGEIVAPHGHRGAVRVLPLTDFPERFLKMQKVRVFTGKEIQVYPVESAGLHKRFILLKLAGVDDIKSAEKLRGAAIKVPRAETVPLPPGHLYVFEIVGLEVWSEEGALIGKVGAVLKTGANDVYSVTSPNGKEILIPAIKEVVREIDVDSGKMLVRLPEGLT